MKLTVKQKRDLYEDFEEIPVDIETFLLDKRYLGNSWVNENGDKTIWDSWLKAGKDVFPLPMRSPYQTVLLSGATGIGKTSFGVNVVMAYYLYIVLCLKNPHEYFDLADQKNIVFAMLNIVTKTMAYKNSWGMLHRALLSSPWFMSRGASTGGRRPEWFCTTKPVELIYGNDASQIIGLDLLCVFLDEVSFARIRNIQAAQDRAKEVFNAALERMKSRFTKFGGIFEGLMIMASSKRTDQAFLEVFTEKLMKGVNGKRVYIVDKPRWEMLPKGTYSGKTFCVAVGDKFKPSQIISNSDVSTYIEAGYRILNPPVEFFDEFDRDLQNALTNIAGVSVQETFTFLRGDLVRRAINKSIKNPFVQSIIYVGAKDDLQYKDFFEINRISPEDRKKPIFIHLDASLGGDGNCLSGVVVSYAQQQLNSATEKLEPELHYRQIFKIKVKAPKGDKVMLLKNRQFVLWLRQQGLNIRKITSDQYQSKDTGQQLTNWGFDYSEQSIDRVTNGVNQPYAVFNNALYENRIELLDDEDQTNELVALEKHEDGRVDKPEGGSDDASQALVGAIFAASNCKVEYLRNNAVLIANTLGSNDLSELPNDIISTLIDQQFSDIPMNGTRVQSSSGLRKDFDTYVDKNNQKPHKKGSPIRIF